jgi:hypothetical protein
MTASDTLQLCGIVLPTIDTLLLERNGALFLSDAFDRLPEFQTTATARAPEAGGTYSSGPVAVTLGVSLGNPVSDSWPPLRQLIEIDDDKDGWPGVTTVAAEGPRFGDPLVDLGSPDVVRANVLHLAARAVVSVRGVVVSCDWISGELLLSAINGKPALDGAIVGCQLSGTGQPCSFSQVEFVDSNAPRMRLTTSAMFVQRRVPDGTACIDVRGMFPGPSE